MTNKLPTTSQATPRTSTILWAVDAFHRQPRAQLRSLEALRRLYAGAPIVIQPVAMLPVGKFDATSSQFLESWNELVKVARRNIDKLTKGLEIPELRPPLLTRVDCDSVSQAVEGLIRIAFEQDADAIAVSSHGRRGTARVLLGSFAETLLLHSPLPVLVVNPKSTTGGKVRTVLFPTDFSPASRSVYERVVRLVAPLRVRLRLFHKVPYYYPGLRYPLFVMPLPTPSGATEVRREIRRTAQPWLDYAVERGVNATLILDTTSGPTAEAILDLSKRLGPGTAIAMASQSTSASTVLLGSLTRQVLRLASCPVLVIHAEQQSLVKKLFAKGKDFAYAAASHPVMT